jgi:hypothetical protein
MVQTSLQGTRTDITRSASHPWLGTKSLIFAWNVTFPATVCHFANVATEPVASLRTKEDDALRSILREAQQASGISQENLSKMLERPINYIDKIEQGTRRLDLIEFLEICDSLKHECGEDILGNQEPNPKLIWRHWKRENQSQQVRIGLLYQTASP